MWWCEGESGGGWREGREAKRSVGEIGSHECCRVLKQARAEVIRDLAGEWLQLVA